MMKTERQEGNLAGMKNKFEEGFQQLIGSEQLALQHRQEQMDGIEKKGKDLTAFRIKTKEERKEMIKKHSGDILR
jgi:hypothetical protein